MKKIKIDWKQLFLEKGERIGLGVAIFFGALFALIGILNIATSASPVANAETLTLLAGDISKRQAGSQPTPEDLPPKAVETSEYVALKPIDPKEFRTEALFNSPSQTDTRKRNPNILSPDEFRVQAVLAQLRSYDLLIDRNTGRPLKVTIVEGGDMPTTLAGPKVGDQKKYNTNLYTTKGAGGPMGPGMPMGAGGHDGRFGYNQGNQGIQSKSVQSIDVDKLDKHPNAVFAEKVWAKPMIVIAGTFPYKEQVEEFRRQLRARSNYEILNASNIYVGTQGKGGMPLFKFEGVVLERLTLSPDGTPVKLPNGKPADWLEIPHERFFKEVAMVTGRRYEPEEGNLPPVLYQISEELLMGLPIQFHENRYPKLLSSLTNITKTVAEIKKNEAKYITPKKSAFDDGDFKAYGPGTGTPGTGMIPGTGTPTPPVIPGMVDPSGMGPAEAMIPEHCMFRIVDTDPRLEPGKTYKYRIRIRMANPNYTPDEQQRKARKDTYPQDAEKQYLISAAVEIPQTATLPAEMHFYAVDQKDIEGPNKYRENKGRNNDELSASGKVFVQVHRWLDVYYPDLKNIRAGRTVGDWSVAERMGVFRGEFVKRNIEVEVSEKPLDQADFILATNPSKAKMPQKKNLFEVTFGDESVMVDFDETNRIYRRVEIPAMGAAPAKIKQIVDKGPTEVLIYTPDGRMIARNSTEDKEDSDRIKRLDEWRQFIEKLRGNTKPGGGGAFGGTP